MKRIIFALQNNYSTFILNIIQISLGSKGRYLNSNIFMPLQYM